MFLSREVNAKCQATQNRVTKQIQTRIWYESLFAAIPAGMSKSQEIRLLDRLKRSTEEF